MPGLIDMPSAGSFKDGTFSINTSSVDESIRTTINFQALPRVNGSFRYSGIGQKNSGYTDDSGYAVWDRSFDLRFDLLKETNFLPSMTIGFQDIIGTGAYSGEYLVGSKIVNNFRGTFGLGWGRLGSQNIIIDNGKRDFGSDVGGSFGGNLRTDQLFDGDIGVFGGLEYRPPIDNLLLKMELSSDSYENVSLYRQQQPSSNVNYGIDYILNNQINFSLYYLHQDTLGFNFSLSASPLGDYPLTFLEEAPEPFYSFPYPNLKEDKNFWERIKQDLKDSNIILLAHVSEKNEVKLIIENNRYSSHSQSIGRTLRIMSKYIDKRVDLFTVILSSYGLPITEITVNRNEVDVLVDAPNAELLLKKISTIKTAPHQLENAILQKNGLLSFDWSIGPYYSLHLFDPNRPVYYDLGLEGNFNYKPRPGIVFRGTTETPILTTFDEVWRGEKGNLPKVRTQLKNYLNETDTKITNLQASSYFKLNKEFYGRITAGIFEQMYGGISTEALYSPDSSNLAFGLEVNRVFSRDYRQLLKFKELDGLSKVNGHLSAYWNTNYKYYFAQLDAGKYLAGDKGSTFTLSRNFPNGWKVGGYFTITDASFSDFGEGSFDKGVYFSIPLSSEWFNFTWRPLTKDPGAKLIKKDNIYNILRKYKY